MCRELEFILRMRRPHVRTKRVNKRMAECNSSALPSNFTGGNALWHYVHSAPKAELHLHIEGTLEPELMFQIAARNQIPLAGTVETHRKKRENFKVGPALDNLTLINFSSYFLGFARFPRHLL